MQKRVSTLKIINAFIGTVTVFWGLIVSFPLGVRSDEEWQQSKITKEFLESVENDEVLMSREDIEWVISGIRRDLEWFEEEREKKIDYRGFVLVLPGLLLLLNSYYFKEIA